MSSCNVQPKVQRFLSPKIRNWKMIDELCIVYIQVMFIRCYVMFVIKYLRRRDWQLHACHSLIILKLKCNQVQDIVEQIYQILGHCYF